MSWSCICQVVITRNRYFMFAKNILQINLCEYTTLLYFYIEIFHNHS